MKQSVYFNMILPKAEEELVQICKGQVKLNNYLIGGQNESEIVI